MKTERLDSLKEIAGYLQCDVRTLGRWEKERGLPLHRIPGVARSRVFALTSELDSWMRGPGASEVPANGAANAARAEDAPGAAADAPALDIPTIKADDRISWLTRRRAAWIFAVGLFAAAVIVATSRFAGPPLTAAKITAGGTQLRAWDAGGKLAWQYNFEQNQEVSLLEAPMQPVIFADLRGDGQRDALVALAIRTPGTNQPPREALYCFSPAGKLLWSYEPQVSLSFVGGTYSAPWVLTDLLVSPKPGARTVWAAFGHHVWWPSFVVRLDAEGKGQLQYVNSGQILRLGYLQDSAGGFLLAGGHNNGYLDAGLAVLKADQPFAHSPQQAGTPYVCRSCPEGAPDLYILFPRLELNVALGIPYNAVSWIRVLNDHVEVSITELPSTKKAFLDGAGVIYDFSNQFSLRSFSVGDAYWGAHRLAEEQGKVRHTAENCPERTIAGHVRILRAGEKWSDERVLSAKKD